MAIFNSYVSSPDGQKFRENKDCLASPYVPLKAPNSGGGSTSRPATHFGPAALILIPVGTTHAIQFSNPKFFMFQCVFHGFTSIHQNTYISTFSVKTYIPKVALNDVPVGWWECHHPN